MKRIRGRRSRLQKLSQRGFRGYPIASISLYGPTADIASKVVIGVTRDANLDVDPLRRWYAEEGDVCLDPTIENEMLAFLRQHGVRTVAMVDRIIGCPHEEGIDYPVGEKCPRCPFWANRDRFTHDLIQ